MTKIMIKTETILKTKIIEQQEGTDITGQTIKQNIMYLKQNDTKRSVG